MTSHALFREAPTPSSALGMHFFGPQHSAPMRFFFWGDVLDELRYAACWDEERCSLCLLLGLYGLAKDGPFIEVTGFQGFWPVRDLHDDASIVHHLRDTIEEVAGERPTPLDAQHPSPVGFMLHVPEGHALLPEPAVRWHLSLFNAPYQIALILDGPNQELALYARRPREPFFGAGFYVLDRVSEAADAHDETPTAAPSEEE